MGSVLESRESSKNEDGKTDIIYKTMYANSEDFQVLAITTMVSSFVVEWNGRIMDKNGMVEIGYTLRGSARPLDNAFHINSSRKNITLRHMRFLVAL